MKQIVTYCAILVMLLSSANLIAQEEVPRPQYIPNWTTYMAETAGGSPAEIRVDLGVQSITPAPAYHFQCSFLLTFKEADSTGLVELEDPELLEQIEERLATSMLWSKGVYFGRVTSNGFRDYYYYLSDSSTFRAKCKRVMQDFPGYTFKMQIEHDPYWFNYYTVYPDEYTIQIQYNEDKMQELREMGDSLTEPRTLQHFANFPTERDRKSFEGDLLRRGYNIIGTGAGVGDLPYGILFGRRQSMEKEKVEEVTLQLVDLSMQNGGYYDGWICDPVITKKK